MQLQIPAYVQDLLNRLHAAGWRACPVGGCIRDSLLGRQPHDWDVAVESTPEQTERALAGIRVLRTGIRHGTVTAVNQGHLVELTTFRVDGAYTDHRRPDTVTFTASLQEDLRRRDFTINAMAWEAEKLVDLFGGQADLRARTIRCVGDPVRRFEEDGLRILRAIRFASTLDFTLDPQTDRAVHAQKERLRDIAAERIAEELQKLFCGVAVGRVLREYQDVIFTLFPELQAEVGCLQRGPYHVADVWEHTVRAVCACPPEVPARLAMLLHDSGKPPCRTEGADGVDHFYRHEQVGAEVAQRVLSRLRLSAELQRTVVQGVRYHMLPMEPKAPLLARRLRQFGPPFCFFLLKLQRADTKAQAPAVQSRLQELDQSEALLRQLLQEQACFSRRQLAVKGNDLLAAGLSGPAVGRALSCLLDAVMDGRCPNHREALLAYWRENLSQETD